MTQALDLILALAVGLFNVLVAIGAGVEGFLRGVMTQAGVGASLQRPVLIAAAVVLILVALRLFGRLFGVLIALFLVLLLLHVLLPGVGHLRTVHV